MYLRPTVASGAVVVSAGRDLDLDYGIFGFTLSAEEGLVRHVMDSLIGCA